jgi:predicted kinase
MNILLIMQGHSGSGKSTLAEQFKLWFEALGHQVKICSTDEQFKVNGVYKFDPSKIGTFHAINQKMATAALESGCTVIVDNTNTMCWEAKPYVESAQALGIPVFFCRATGDYQNTHGVPEQKVEAMKARMESLSVEACLASKAPWEK